MKLKLGIKERINVRTIFRQQDSMVNMVLATDILKKTSLNQEEIKTVDLISNNDGTVKWNDDKDERNEIAFTKLEVQYLKDLVTEADKNKKITIENITLCEKIKSIEIVEGAE